jgi:ABC-type antimicrobial peptide transport system permease subunit
MRKILLLLVIAIAASSVFTSCNQQNNPEDGTILNKDDFISNYSKIIGSTKDGKVYVLDSYEIGIFANGEPIVDEKIKGNKLPDEIAEKIKNSNKELIVNIQSRVAITEKNKIRLVALKYKLK